MPFLTYLQTHQQHHHHLPPIIVSVLLPRNCNVEIFAFDLLIYSMRTAHQLLICMMLIIALPFHPECSAEERCGNGAPNLLFLSKKAHSRRRRWQEPCSARDSSQTDTRSGYSWDTDHSLDCMQVAVAIMQLEMHWPAGFLLERQRNTFVPPLLVSPTVQYSPSSHFKDQLSVWLGNAYEGMGVYNNSCG